ncbi:MAG: Hsp33 family molecular chaperone HslO [Alphaproteobacteria bacterium]|nr:Hsp33 family molecular chaperone HslO [Alphaproteobacteria bacterium]
MDIIQPFLLEKGLFRGSVIRADKAVADIWACHDYPDMLRPVLAQGVLAALALGGTLKYDGVFSLQVRGDGPVSTLFVDLTHDGKVRAYMTYDPRRLPPQAAALGDLFGAGQMLFSVAQVGREPYQGVVALNPRALADTIADYFRQSEQTDTQLVALSRGKTAGLIFLQRMPVPPGQDAAAADDAWETACVLMRSVAPDELCSDTLPAADVLFRLFHAQQVAVLPARTPAFACRCSQSRMQGFLQKLPAAERDDLYQADTIQTACQFCGRVFQFNRKDFT